MPQPTADPDDLVGQLLALKREVEKLSSRSGTRQFATAERPAPATMEGSLIYNKTTKTFQGSNGTNWFDL